MDGAGRESVHAEWVVHSYVLRRYLDVLTVFDPCGLGREFNPAAACIDPVGRTVGKKQATVELAVGGLFHACAESTVNQASAAQARRYANERDAGDANRLVASLDCTVDYRHVGTEHVIVFEDDAVQRNMAAPSTRRCECVADVRKAEDEQVANVPVEAGVDVFLFDD